MILEEQSDGSWRRQDAVRMELPVDLAEPFDLADLDYLKDTDGDGVGDVNERSAKTDPADPESTPGASTVDLLALYTDGFADLHHGDPTTRIQHVVTLANAIFADSGLALRFRVVGMPPVEVDLAAKWPSPDREVLTEEALRHGSDLSAVFRRRASHEKFCGRAYIGGYRTRGRMAKEQALGGSLSVADDCSGRTLAHEIGHTMGLGHSVWQGATGTWRWSRGHGVGTAFGTVMSYGPPGLYIPDAPTTRGTLVDVFSDPDASCRGAGAGAYPCGVDRDARDGADAVASLDAVRFQIAAFQDGHPDSDGDGFVDPVDELPEDGSEWLDTDGDGVGNNADEDDDGDGVDDGDDAFPLDAGETTDTDGDGVGDNGDVFPDDPDEWADTDGDGVGDNADEFPDDPEETTDSDGDGVGDNGDAFPEDPNEWADTDGDGVGDNADTDADGDGVANRHDVFPLDAAKFDIASYVFVAEAPGDRLGDALLATGGEDARLVIGAPGHDASRGAVYLISVADLTALDAADGLTDRQVDLRSATAGTASWKLLGENLQDAAGTSASSTGDMDGDGVADIVVGAQSHSPGDLHAAGAVYFISGADLATADAADGVSDHTISLARVAAQPRSRKIVGSDFCGSLGASTAVDDLDGDGHVELIVGAPALCWRGRPGPGSALVTSLDDLGAADAADGREDGVASLDNVVAQPDSYRLAGEIADARTGGGVGVVGDLDDDGVADLGIGAPEASGSGQLYGGLAYLVSTGGLAAADAADGQRDGVVDLAMVPSRTGFWRVAGKEWSFLGRRLGRTGSGEILVGGETTHVLARRDLAGIDAADGAADGMIAGDLISAGGDSWTFRYLGNVDFVEDVDGDGREDVVAVGLGTVLLFAVHALPALDDANAEADNELTAWRIRRDDQTWQMQKSGAGRFPTVAAAGDFDGDGLADILLSERPHHANRKVDRIYLLAGADLAVLDRVDDSLDRELRLGSVAGDTDGDGLANTLDPDDDDDGYPDSEDAFQLDPAEWVDSDFDGVGDNADAFPEDPREQFDTDGDGVGDRADDDDDGDGIPDRQDEHPLDTDNDGVENRDDPDDDGDGVADEDDDLPVDPTESVDTDGDGLGNNADDDDDNDGVADADDEFPLDSTEWRDSDGDGTGDNADAFPNDPDEQADSDGDGIGDNADTVDDRLLDVGDTPESAALLPIGPPLAGTIGDADDVDVFRIDLQGSATLEVRTSGPTDVRGELQDGNGTRIAADDDSGPGGRNFLVRADLEAGIYYVAVAGEPGDYAVMARLGDAPDHGDTEATATLLTLYAEADLDGVSPSALLAAPGRIAPTTADVDVFRLDVPLDGTDVTVRSVGGTDVFGRLLDASMNELAADASDGNFQMAVTVDAGTYYVAVTASETGTYRVLAWGDSASCPCNDGPAPDHGGDAESSTLMPIGPPLPGTVGDAADVDVFRIDLQGSATLEVRTSGPTDTRGELLDATGARIVADDDSGPGGRNFLVRADLEAGVYYVAVRGDPGDYAVMARLGDAPDHGDTEATSTLLTLYAEADLDRVSPTALLAAPGRIAPTPDDADVFRLDVPEYDMAVTVRSAGATDVFARVLDASLHEIASDASDGNFRVEQRLDRGIYYVEVRGRETGTYRVLAWGESSCPCAAAPPATGNRLTATGVGAAGRGNFGP